MPGWEAESTIDAGLDRIGQPAAGRSTAIAERPASRGAGSVLGGAGGVAGGAFHAGVLAALEEATGWDPRRARLVVGTSAGSISGAALRAGLSAPDMLARAAGPAAVRGPASG